MRACVRVCVCVCVCVCYMHIIYVSSRHFKLMCVWGSRGKWVGLGGVRVCVGVCSCMYVCVETLFIYTILITFVYVHVRLCACVYLCASVSVASTRNYQVMEYCVCVYFYLRSWMFVS